MKALDEMISNTQAEYVFNNDSGGIEQVILLMHLGENKEHVSLNRSRTMPIGAMGFSPGDVLGGFEMSANSSKGEVLFQQKTPDGLQIKKRFTIPQDASAAPAYTVNLEVSFANPGYSPIRVPDFFV